MVELFRNPQIDWIAAKKYFIAMTIFLLLVGALSVQIRGFNLGVDFTGGTLLMIRFKEPPDLDKVRSALGRSNIDISKVTLQPVVTNPTELLIHAPQLAGAYEAARRVDQDKRAIISALQRLNPGGDDSSGEVNINSIDAAGIKAELRGIDPLGINARQFANAHPYRQIAAFGGSTSLIAKANAYRQE